MTSTAEKKKYKTFIAEETAEETQHIGARLNRLSPDSQQISFHNRLISLSYSTGIVIVATLAIFFCSILLISSPIKSSSDSVELKKNFRPVESSNSKSVVLESNAEQYFSFKRVGYESIDYFDRSVTTIFKYKFLDSYLSIIEPSADMEFKLYDAYRSSKNSYDFEICPATESGMKGTSTSCKYGSRSYNATTGKASSSSINFKCSPYDEFDVSITETSFDTGDVVSTFTGKALCLYIRRELRSLPEDDITALTNHMFKLWSTTDTEGVAKYGENFHNITYLLRFHHFNAADRKTDHIHNGNGIILQHIKFTNIFEESLQAIDPSVALPYWDFTIDTSEGKKANESFVMNAAMFGSMHKPTHFGSGFTYSDDRIEQGAIVDGLWKNFKSDFNVFEDMNYAYGYLRAPWNLNPSPYVSRFTFNMTAYNMPSCEDHYQLLGFESLMTFFDLGEFAPHGNVHILTGGSYGCDLFNPLLEAGYIVDEDTAKRICVIWSAVILKTAYRYHYITPDKNCVVNPTDLRLSECGYTCNADTKQQLVQYIASLTKTGDKLNLDFTKAGAAEAWLSFICEGGDGAKVFSGDNYESASPIDPVFWLIHPPLERLLHVKMMGGGFEDEEWHSDPVLQTVCDFAQCYSEEEGAMGYYDDCCYGHYENDRLLDAVSGDRTKYFGPTNAETLAASDPRSESYSMPYVYDSFKWDHCQEDFTGYVTKAYATKQKAKQMTAA